MTIMKQITKQFKNLAPEWDEELKNPLKKGQETKNPKLDLGSFDHCIVGEIHGFSDYYIYRNTNNCCVNCVNLAKKLSHESTLKRNNPVIVELVNHINESHPKLMKGKKC